MHRPLASTLAIAALATTLLACEGSKGPEGAEAAEPPLEGAWMVVSVQGADSAAGGAVLPGLYLFTDHHYSIMRATGSGPRALAVGDSVTDAEKLAAYDSFVANSGSYEVADSTLTIHPVVARSPNFMAGGSDKYTFRISGDTLWLSNSGADFKTMIGGQLVTPPGRSQLTTMLVKQP